MISPGGTLFSTPPRCTGFFGIPQTMHLSSLRAGAAHSAQGGRGNRMRAAGHAAGAPARIGLPGMDGNELARQLRKLPGMADAALAAVTGYGRPQDKETAFAAGFAHHFVKPLDTEKLLARIGEVTGER